MKMNRFGMVKLIAVAVLLGVLVLLPTTTSYAQGPMYGGMANGMNRYAPSAMQFPFMNGFRPDVDSFGFRPDVDFLHFTPNWFFPSRPFFFTPQIRVFIFPRFR